MVSDAVVRHVVLFTLHPPKDLHVRQFAERLLAMRGRIPGLLRVEVGIDQGRTPRSSDLSLITEHESWAALERYQSDPVHREVLDFARTVVAHSTVVDCALGG